ncbi:YncE family protein [Streptomyces nitrosporeus]|uniref:YncE family protein n=1 Tax=Streptomyces nitrosporeus TaxID=28894 RepID=UPI0039A11D90
MPHEPEENAPVDRPTGPARPRAGGAGGSGRDSGTARRTGRAALLVVSVLAVTLAGCGQDGGPREAGSGGRPDATAAPPPAPSPAPGSGGADQGTTGRGAATGSSAVQDSLLVTDFGSDTVTFVDPAPRNPEQRKAAAGRPESVVAGTAPYGVALGDDGTAWVATAEGVAAVDTRTRERTALIAYTTDTGPVTHGEYRGGGMGIALSPDGRHVYVGVNVPGADGVLEIIDTRSRRVVGSVPVGRRPFDVDVSSDGRQVYATGHDSFDVTVIDTADRQSRRIEVAPYGTEGGLGSWLKPHYTAVRPSDGALLLPFEGERLAVVDPDTGRVRVERMTADTHQHGTAITDDGVLYVVGTGPIDPAEDHGPSLTIREPDGGERVIPLDGAHEDVVVSADGRTAYVSGGFTREGHWDGLSVVDITTGEVRRVPVGTRPLGMAVL